LDYVHSRQIIHRDIKPDNIMVRHRDGKPVLIDFGAVRESMGTVVNSQGNLTSSIVIGTPGFMPSEQAAGRPMYSSDLYSLGLTAIYLLTGRHPQQLGTDSQTGEILWREYASHVSPRIAEVIDRAIAYHPRDRYPTARAMLDALQEITNPIPPTQPVIQKPQPPTIPITPQQPTQSKNQNGLLMGGLIAGGLIGAAVIVPQVFPKPSQPIAESSVTPSNTASKVVKITTASPSVEASQTTISKVPQTFQQAPIVQKRLEFTPPPATSTPLDVVETVENYFWLSRRPVTDADLHSKDGFTLDIMRNSIFARHGRRFDTPGLQEYFDNQSWYNPTYSPKKFPAKLLSKLEQRNIDYIAQYQDRYQLRYFKK
jgi:serine/threonine-protein kinase